VINGDGVTINSATSPAKRGDVISIYATGQGFLANAPRRWRHSAKRACPNDEQPESFDRRLYG